MPAKRNIIGRRFGRAIVIAEADPYILNGHPYRRSLCQCDCGKIFVTLNNQLIRKKTKSCGCFRQDFSRSKATIHGYTKTRIYGVWWAMIQRCHDPNNEYYADYGGRGISVCTRWDRPHGFVNFLSDMGEGKKGWTLERLDTNKGYSIWNCVWATQKRQQRNRRNNRKVIIDGKTYCVSEICELNHIPASRVYHRLNKGWSDKDAVFTPV